MVCLGSISRRATASWLNSLVPSGISATVEGCSRRPCRSGTITTSPAFTEATTEFVVPRSMPRTAMTIHFTAFGLDADADRGKEMAAIPPLWRAESARQSARVREPFQGRSVYVPAIPASPGHIGRGSKTHWPLAALQASRVHSFMSLQTLGVPTHWPPLQVSVVQAIPSLQVPAAGLQAPSMRSQALQTAQVLGGPATQVPEVLHRSPWVQALPSSQGGRFGLAAPSHLPVVGLHCLQVVGLLQSTAVPRRHTPPWQLSPAVHRFRSASQGVPLSLLANVQAPVGSEQVPGDTWQVLVLVQTFGVPVQTPAMHLS